jgi:hypothetical protein
MPIPFYSLFGFSFSLVEGRGQAARGGQKVKILKNNFSERKKIKPFKIC